METFEVTFTIDAENLETAEEWLDAHLPPEEVAYDVRKVEGKVRDGRGKVRFDTAAR